MKLIIKNYGLSSFHAGGKYFGIYTARGVWFSFYDLPIEYNVTGSRRIRTFYGTSGYETLNDYFESKEVSV